MVLQLDLTFRRLLLCYIDFADPTGTFNYEHCLKVLNISARPADAPEQEQAIAAASKLQSAPEKTAEASASPAGILTSKPRQSLLQSSDPMNWHVLPAPRLRARSPLCLRSLSPVSALSKSSASENSSDAELIPIGPKKKKKKKTSKRK